MLKHLVVTSAFFFVSAGSAAPSIVPISTFPSSDNFVMESPATDCRYAHAYADVTIGAEGTYGLFKKAGAQRISTFTCAIRVDNSRIPTEIAMWSNQVVNNLNNIATCNLYFYQNSGTVTTLPMTPMYFVPSASIAQYKVDTLTGINSSGLYITSAGIACDAQDGVSMISVLGLGVKYVN